MNKKKILILLFSIFLVLSIFLSIGYTYFFNYVTTQVFVIINAFFGLAFLLYLGIYAYNNYNFIPNIINLGMLMWFIILIIDHLSSMFFDQGIFGIVSLFVYPIYILSISIPHVILLPIYNFFKKQTVRKTPWILYKLNVN